MFSLGYVKAPLCTLEGTMVLSDQAISLPPGNVPANAVLRALANGPLTPKVNLPLAIIEMKDIPKMLRHAGDLLHNIRRPSNLSPDKEAAAATLAYQFGWKPLIEDILKMINFADAVKKKQNILERAHSTKGVRLRTHFGEDQTTSGGSYPVWSQGSLHIRQNYKDFKSSKSWATVRWTVKDKSQIGRIPSYQDGFRNALGLNRGMIPITVWKALPWTWAIDWFADISNHLQKSYNLVYYNPSKVCIMSHTKTTRVWEPYISDKYPHPHDGSKPGEVLESVSFRERKSRTIHNPSSASLRLALPFLDGFKLSILGSLSILAIRNRR